MRTFINNKNDKNFYNEILIERSSAIPGKYLTNVQKHCNGSPE